MLWQSLVRRGHFKTLSSAARWLCSTEYCIVSALIYLLVVNAGLIKLCRCLEDIKYI